MGRRPATGLPMGRRGGVGGPPTGPAPPGPAEGVWGRAPKGRGGLGRGCVRGGADSAIVSAILKGTSGLATAVSAAAAGTTIAGAYGQLTIHQDGSYSYSRDAGTAGGVNDVFTYTLKDGDGDTVTTTLTIALGD